MVDNEELSEPHQRVVAEAIKRREHGATMFAPTLAPRSYQIGWEVPPLEDWGPVIEAIEHAGWKLEHWAVTEHPRGAEACPVFRAVRGN